MTRLSLDKPSPGFVELVAAARLDPFESQAVFRTMLDCLARPGSLRCFPVSVVSRRPAVLLPVLSLADVDVTAATIESVYSSGNWADVVKAATGVRIVEIETANFVVAIDPIRAEVIAQLSRGTALAPERGARLSVACRSIVNDDRRRNSRSADVSFSIEGPGVAGTQTLALVGVGPAEIEALATANADGPAGIDTWFVADDGTVAALPRSSRLRILRSPAKAH